MKKVFNLLIVFLPWFLRRRFLIRFYGYRIDPTARIGLSYVFPDKLTMGPHSRIGPLTVAINLHEISLAEYATIGKGNWITGFPVGTVSPHFAHQKEERVSRLILAQHSAITNRHIIDCTHAVSLGAFSTMAGFRSQILTHSIDLALNRQDSAPVTIGAFCFIGTDVVILGGSALPDYTVLGAKSLLNKAYEETYTLYAGQPAKPIKFLDPEMKYFNREKGTVI